MTGPCSFPCHTDLCCRPNWELGFCYLLLVKWMLLRLCTKIYGCSILTPQGRASGCLEDCPVPRLIWEGDNAWGLSGRHIGFLSDLENWFYCIILGLLSKAFHEAGHSGTLL